MDGASPIWVALGALAALAMKIYDKRMADRERARDRQEKVAGLVLYHLPDAVRLYHQGRKADNASELLDLIAASAELASRVNRSLNGQQSQPLTPTEHEQHIIRNLSTLQEAVAKEPKPF